MATVLLIDNGSLRADATLQLRNIATRLADRSNIVIHPVSLHHSDQISADKLGGIPAQVFASFLDDKLSSGERSFIVLPLFFGMSRALTSLIPQQVDVLKKKYGDFQLTIADVIHPLPAGEPLLVDLLHDHIASNLSDKDVKVQHAVLVDHGSPVRHITDVRRHVAQALQQKLNQEIQLGQAVMERREGAAYDFNGPLLQQWLEEKAAEGIDRVLVVLMFFLPGRHAGEGGDIETICQGVMDRYPGFNAIMTTLIGEHPALIDILSSRLQDSLNR